MEVLTLKIKLTVILPAKEGVFENSRGLHFRTSKLQQSHRQVHRQRRGTALLPRKTGS